jgi:hypothetical protein
MKARIFIENKEVFSSNKISRKNLDKKETELKQKFGCQKMTDIVNKGYKVFIS